MIGKIEAEWLAFRWRDVATEAPDVQLMEMRKAFYGGAASAAKIAAEAVMPEFTAYIKAEDERRRAKR